MTDHPTVEAAVAAGRRQARETTSVLSGVPDQLGDSFAAAVGLIADLRGKVVTTAVGTSGAVAARMAHLLSVCGTPAFFVDSGQARHGSLGALHPSDLLIAVSQGGRSVEVTEVCRLAAERGVTVVAITADPASPFAEAADLVVDLQAGGADPGGLVSMGSSLAVALWGDALAAALMALRDHRMSDVVSLHPGGAVGLSAMGGDD